jgi:hypothetical protein
MGIRSFLRLRITSARAREFIRRVLMALLVATILLAGLQLRRWIAENTRHVRYQHDIVNGFYWGSEVLAEARRLSPDEASADSWTAFWHGYFGLYDRVKDEAYENDYGLDYPPLRLLAMAIWAKHVRNEFPGVDDGHPRLVNPLLKINLLCELLSALAIFFLVRFCVQRANSSPSPSPLGEEERPPASAYWSRNRGRASGRSASPLRGERTEMRGHFAGLAAASVAWLEPSMILDAHGWPQWDVWVLPFYLFAALAALKNRWFCCGCLLAAGAMLKGQLLFVAPFFVLWPLWQKRWTRALRVVAGFTATTALVVSPWILRGPLAWISVGIVASVTFSFLVKYKHRQSGAWLAGIAGCAAFFIGAFTGGSFTWLQVGFLYGSEHYPYLFISSCYNLASLLAELGWSLKDSLLSAHIGSLDLDLTLQWALRLLYLGALVLCARGMARHLRARDPRMLIAIATPWLLMFALLGQMHERYLMWGAVVSAVALGVSIRLSIVHFVISAASTAMIMHVMLIDKKLDSTLRTIDVLHSIRPYASVLVLGCVAVYFWGALPVRIPVFRRGSAKDATTPSLSLGAEPEEA